MSALGHKWTFHAAIVMSALPPKVDIRRCKMDVNLMAKLHFDPLVGAASSDSTSSMEKSR
jgi:hypothetical protein